MKSWPALHISISQLKTYIRCPQSYYLKYVLGAEPAFYPRALAFGSAIHRALAFYYQTIQDRQTDVVPRSGSPCHPECQGWLHIDDPVEVQACDDCGRFQTSDGADDDAAQVAHDLECADTRCTYRTRELSGGVVPSVQSLIEVFRETWRWLVDNEPVEAAEPDDPDPVDLGAAMLRAFHNIGGRSPPPKVLLVEHPFTIPLISPVSGEVLEEALVGTLDLVIQEAGGSMVVEHKTSARRYTDDQLTYDLQMSGYRYAAEAVGLGAAGLRFQVLTKTRCPEVQVADVAREPAAIEVFLTTTFMILRALEYGIFYPLPGWICRSCPFAHVCTAVVR
jgi:CRISPR/Cas system-associated exonuclease Cas4 (RecB family)